MFTQNRFFRFSQLTAVRTSAVFSALVLTAAPALAADFDLAGMPHQASDSKSAKVAPSSGGWKLVEHGNGQAVELTRRGSGGGFSAVCSNGQCSVFVEPDSACQPSRKYPILLNSARRMGVISGTCRVVADVSGPRRVVQLDQREALFAAMVREEDLSLAFPSADGEMDVIEVTMKGVLPMLQAAITHRSSELGGSNPPQSKSPRASVKVLPSPVEIAVGKSATRYSI